MPDIFTQPETKKSKIESPMILTSTTPGIFSNFVYRPQGLSFASQEYNEQIILLMRRDFITNTFWIFTAVIFIFLPFVVSYMLKPLLSSPLPIPPQWTIIFFSIYYLIIIGYALYNFADWFYNIGIITDKRIIDITFTNLTDIDVAATRLTEIEDISYAQKGFMASFFDYGDVVARTVAAKDNFVFENKPRPAQIVDIVSKLIGD